MLATLAHQKKKIKVTAEAYLGCIGSSILRHMNYVNHVNYENISMF